MGFFSNIFGSKREQQQSCNLWIGDSPENMTPVDDPEGLGGYELAIDRLIREQAPEKVFLRSDTSDLSVVRKALSYLSRIGGEVGIAPQLPDEEVAEIFGVDVQSYRLAVTDPNGNAAEYG